jgi:hypothetical protein
MKITKKVLEDLGFKFIEVECCFDLTMRGYKFKLRRSSEYSNYWSFFGDFMDEHYVTDIEELFCVIADEYTKIGKEEKTNEIKEILNLK